MVVTIITVMAMTRMKTIVVVAVAVTLKELMPVIEHNASAARRAVYGATRRVAGSIVGVLT